ncbi:diacylglycerol kinase family enzyme [Rhodobacter viridis]|uniref:Diacylglycerol kinase family enzyme n=1 Tax=Rhodobacter viridis TaxID=1054202 RepID=A0A318TTL2_9RHOB|nr:diacylglycerol kinase family protein [Rhodobacter viridis]PYF08112.1 diacylglycerol kinase family enzyme [Rhodobacter viridis]
MILETRFPPIPRFPAGAAEQICVVVNSGSGTGASERIAALHAAFERHFPQGGWTLLSGGPEKIVPNTRAALAQGVGTLVACGGDGTISAVADTIHGAGVRLGVIPTGTFNFFARGLGIPEDIDAAVAVLAGGTARAVQAGLVNDRLFLNNASIGLYPRILREREAIYRRWGRSRLAAHWSVLRTMLVAPGGMWLTIEGATGTRRVHSPLAFVMNSPYQLDFLGIAGAGRLRAGELALLLAPETSLRAMLTGALKLGMGWAERHVDYQIDFGSAFTITPAKPRLLTARDGERSEMATPLHYRALPEGLTVIGPELSARAGAAEEQGGLAETVVDALAEGIPA